MKRHPSHSEERKRCPTLAAIPTSDLWRSVTAFSRRSVVELHVKEDGVNVSLDGERYVHRERIQRGSDRSRRRAPTRRNGVRPERVSFVLPKGELGVVVEE